MRVISPDSAILRQHRHLQQSREKGGGHGDTGRGPFLGNAALGEVHAHLQRGQQLVVRRLLGLALAAALIGAEARLRRPGLDQPAAGPAQIAALAEAA